MVTLVVTVSVVVLVLNVAGATPQQVPCFFVFGDYDFSGELTGIFPSHKFSVDSIPPYATASGEELLKGVNYLSPAAGSSPKSGHNVQGSPITLAEQVQNYQSTLSELVKVVGNEDTAANHVRKCVYLVGIGSNDYLNNYFVPESYSDGRDKHNVDDLIEQYYEQLEILYKYGARKVGLIGECQMGCSPNQLDRNSHGSLIQSACHVFKDNLKSLVNELNQNLHDATFSFLDISLNHPAPYVSILQDRVHEEPQVPCYFIFGDSLADNGNNNFLITSAKVNYPPYGIDFPNGPTGRFCNGRTMFDLLAELLGFESYMPAFAYATDDNILRGVNYASGAAGIRDESGAVQGAHISMNGQLQNHEILVSRISTILGSNDTAQDYLNKCLYSVAMGSNDYLNNYYLPQYYNTSSLYSPEEYAEVLAEQYSQQLESLYNLGARKVAVIGVGKIGCTPYAILYFGSNDSSCVEYMNNASNMFNIKLISLVDEFNTNVTDAQFIFVNSSGMVSEDLSPLGFTVSDVGCCEVGDAGLCVPLGTPCQNRSEYTFWDSFHPTEALNFVTAIKSYNSSSISDAYPMGIHTLVNL